MPRRYAVRFMSYMANLAPVSQWLLTSILCRCLMIVAQDVVETQPPLASEMAKSAASISLDDRSVQCLGLMKAPHVSQRYAVSCTFHDEVNASISAVSYFDSFSMSDDSSSGIPETLLFSVLGMAKSTASISVVCRPFRYWWLVIVAQMPVRYHRWTC
jgi:hypothetical protein